MIRRSMRDAGPPLLLFGVILLAGAVSVHPHAFQGGHASVSVEPTTLAETLPPRSDAIAQLDDLPATSRSLARSALAGGGEGSVTVANDSGDRFGPLKGDVAYLVANGSFYRPVIESNDRTVTLRLEATTGEIARADATVWIDTVEFDRSPMNDAIVRAIDGGGTAVHRDRVDESTREAANGSVVEYRGRYYRVSVENGQSRSRSLQAILAVVGLVVSVLGLRSFERSG